MRNKGGSASAEPPFIYRPLYIRYTSFQVLRGLEGSEKQRLQALEKRRGIFSDFEVRGQRGEKYLLTNQAPQGKARPLGTGTPQGAKVPYRIRQEFDGGITQGQKIDKTLNADFGTETVVSQRPEGLLLIIGCFNIPAESVNRQRKKVSVRIGEQNRFRVRQRQVKMNLFRVFRTQKQSALI